MRSRISPYLVYITLFIITFINYGDAFQHALAADQGGDSWLVNGVRYAGYNVNLPAVLFCMVLPSTWRQAIGAGVIAGGLLLLSVFGATAIGIVDLIAKGYGFLTWVFIAILIVPLLTVGIWKIRLLSPQGH